MLRQLVTTYIRFRQKQNPPKRVLFFAMLVRHFSKLKRLVQGANPQAVNLVRQGEATHQSPL